MLDLLLDYYSQFCEIVKDDNVVFLGLLVSSFPAALFMKYIPDASSKQMFSIIVALIQTYTVCGRDMVIPLLMCALSYVALWAVPKHLVGRVIFHAMFSILLVFRLLIFSGSFQPSYLTNAVLLLMTLRICSYAYDYQHNVTLESDAKEGRVSTISSPMDYVGYCFCFVGYWTGPFYNYKTYNDMLHAKTLIRSSKLALWHMRWALILLPLHITQNIFAPTDYIKEDEFLERSLLFKCVYQFACFYTFKVKFYIGWLVAEGMCIACNLGLEEREDGVIEYDTIINVDIYNVEKQWMFSECVRAWNKSVQRWMKTYVYETTKLPKSVRTDFVFALSAFWHGVRPGYYLCFICGPPLIKLQQKVSNLTRSARQSNKCMEYLFITLNWWLMRITMTFFLTPFIVLELDRTLQVWSSMYWIPQIWLSIVILIGVLLPQGDRQKKTQ